MRDEYPYNPAWMACPIDEMSDAEVAVEYALLMQDRKSPLHNDLHLLHSRALDRAKQLALRIHGGKK